MRTSRVEPEARHGTFTRRTLLGAGAAALLGAVQPVTGASGRTAPWAREVVAPVSPRAAQSVDPLPSWNEGPRRQAILDFVAAATDRETDDFVPIPARVATFDLDGTLWVEQPLYVQSTATVERIRAIAPDHPDWQSVPPFSTVLSGDDDAIHRLANAEWQQLMGASHAGMTLEEYTSAVDEWLATTRHPRYHRLYTELVYEPMLEVMAYLRDNDFRTYIVSGSGQEFIRVFADQIFGIPPEQILGTTFELTYEMGSDGVPVIRIDSSPQLDNNFAGKPEDIALFIGRRPAAAFGNSTGDQQMLEWANGGERAMLMMLVYHDDPDREYAYGPAGGLPNTHVGTFTETLLTEANERGWQVISMKYDWARIFPFA